MDEPSMNARSVMLSRGESQGTEDHVQYDIIFMKQKNKQNQDSGSLSLEVGRGGMVGWWGSEHTL